MTKTFVLGSSARPGRLSDLVNEQVRTRFLETFTALEFDPGLAVDDATVIDVEHGPCLLVRYTDHRYPDRRLAGWWDLRRYHGDLDDPAEIEGLASFAKVWLEELFHAGPPLTDRPVDDDGAAWAEMEVLDPALPPHIRRGTGYVVADLRLQPPVVAHVELGRAYVGYAGPEDWRSALAWARARADRVIVRIIDQTYWAGRGPAPDGLPLIPETPMVPLDAALDGLRRAERWRNIAATDEEGEHIAPSNQLAELDRQALLPTRRWFRRARRRRRTQWVVLGDPDGPARG